MGCWWLDETPYPGPDNSYQSIAEITEAFTKRISTSLVVSQQTYKLLQKYFAEVASKVNDLEISARIPPFDPPDLDSSGRPRPPKPSPMPAHVGPRPSRQFDHRGRRKI